MKNVRSVVRNKRPQSPSPTSGSHDKVLAFYRLGATSLSAYPIRMPYSRRSSTETPQERSAAEHVRRARRFAATYTEGELKLLFRLANRHDMQLNVAHFSQLTTIPNRRSRLAATSKVIKDHLSRQQLDQLVRRQFGKRRMAGRHFTIRSRQQMEDKLTDFCSKFLALFGAISGNRPFRGDGDALWRQLGKRRQKVLREIELKVRQLQMLLMPELGKHDRSPRQSPRLSLLKTN